MMTHDTFHTLSEGAMTHTLSAEQQAMEKRYYVPHNWCKGPHTRHVRQKEGIWKIASVLAGDIRSKQVLDAGCGDGWYTARIARTGARVKGIDYSERAVRFAQAIVDTAEFATGSLSALPYPDHSFDVVFSFQVLEHIPPDELPKAISEIARVTKPDGKIIVSV
ncbi:class I SAM-dependent methyltransferase, partial [Candidatus Kaiserbacteria bacterium]|nr:class I SAM-dependent methyltransferase [Candidatus Kaiserbacteria bacterium]